MRRPRPHESPEKRTLGLLQRQCAAGARGSVRPASEATCGRRRRLCVAGRRGADRGPQPSDGTRTPSVLSSPQRFHRFVSQEIPRAAVASSADFRGSGGAQGTNLLRNEQPGAEPEVARAGSAPRGLRRGGSRGARRPIPAERTGGRCATRTGHARGGRRIGRAVRSRPSGRRSRTSAWPRPRGSSRPSNTVCRAPRQPKLRDRHRRGATPTTAAFSPAPPRIDPRT